MRAGEVEGGDVPDLALRALDASERGVPLTVTPDEYQTLKTMEPEGWEKALWEAALRHHPVLPGHGLIDGSIGSFTGLPVVVEKPDD